MADLAPEGTRSDAKQHEKAYDSFDSVGLREDLLRGVRAYGLEKPSAIQQRGIVAFCEGRDVIIEKDQSGTTKTAMFCVGILQRLDCNVPKCQAVVIAPTRELALQIEKVICALGEYLGVRVHASVGGGAGAVAERQILSCGIHVLVGTPGLVFGVLRRSSVRGECVKMFVLDGIDEMLSRGFKDHIHEMFQLLLPPKIQVGVVSATMLPEVMEITTKFMNTPVKIPDLSKDR